MRKLTDHGRDYLAFQFDRDGSTFTVDLRATMKLMKASSLPLPYEEVATGTFEDGVDFRIGIAINAACFYLFTDYLHPDSKYPHEKAMYVLSIKRALLEEMAEAFMRANATPAIQGAS